MKQQSTVRTRRGQLRSGKSSRRHPETINGKAQAQPRAVRVTTGPRGRGPVSTASINRCVRPCHGAAATVCSRDRVLHSWRRWAARQREAERDRERQQEAARSCGLGRAVHGQPDSMPSTAAQSMGSTGHGQHHPQAAPVTGKQRSSGSSQAAAVRPKDSIANKPQSALQASTTNSPRNLYSFQLDPRKTKQSKLKYYLFFISQSTALGANPAQHNSAQPGSTPLHPSRANAAAGTRAGVPRPVCQAGASARARPYANFSADIVSAETINALTLSALTLSVRTRRRNSPAHETRLCHPPLPCARGVCRPCVQAVHDRPPSKRAPPSWLAVCRQSNPEPCTCAPLQAATSGPNPAGSSEHSRSIPTARAHSKSAASTMRSGHRWIQRPRVLANYGPLGQ